ncbi:MAG: response regulator RpfG family c-di-GMP phosphodiesterase [Psychrosphaera sp.]|jgi:response regulator RpfG family c-di-GMP phosphodiesterase
MLFNNNASAEMNNIKPTWKVLIVDDEEDIHVITKLALKRFELDGKRLEFVSAYDSLQAKEIINQQNEFSLIFLDVVMETDHAGLDFAKWLRETKKNKFSRIVLRTGQPGQAPEEDVIMEYDINDYKQKTELDRKKLFTTVVTALRAYRDLLAVEDSRQYERKFRHGLEQVIEATSDMLKRKDLQTFFDGLLQQVMSILHIDNDGGLVNVSVGAGAGTKLKNQGYDLIAKVGDTEQSELTPQVIQLLNTASKIKESIFEDNIYVAYFPSTTEKSSLLYLTGISLEDIHEIDIQMLNMFCRSVGIAFDNFLLNQDIINTQEELLVRLGNAVESRSKESGNHIKRMSDYCYLLGQKLNLSEFDCITLKQATPMHDVGKIATPDSILLKPGKLESDEFTIMKLHTQIGYDILKDSELPILQAAAIISQQHHEKYDGTGYPNNFKGEEIHIYARIVAVADVFDALAHKRCYKEPWPLDSIITLLEEEKGKHFDPMVVDAFLQNLDEFLAINERLTGEDQL